MEVFIQDTLGRENISTEFEFSIKGGSRAPCDLLDPPVRVHAYTVCFTFKIIHCAVHQVTHFFLFSLFSKRPYVTLGTLRDQVIYPDTRTADDQYSKGINDEQLEEFLKQVINKIYNNCSKHSYLSS